MENRPVSSEGDQQPTETSKLQPPPPLAFYIAAAVFAAIMAALTLFEYASRTGQSAAAQTFSYTSAASVILLGATVISGISKRARVIALIEIRALDLTKLMHAQKNENTSSTQVIEKIKEAEKDLIHAGAYDSARRIAAARRELGTK